MEDRAMLWNCGFVMLPACLLVRPKLAGPTDLVKRVELRAPSSGRRTGGIAERPPAPHHEVAQGDCGEHQGVPGAEPQLDRREAVVVLRRDCQDAPAPGAHEGTSPNV